MCYRSTDQKRIFILISLANALSSCHYNSFPKSSNPFFLPDSFPIPIQTQHGTYALYLWVSPSCQTYLGYIFCPEIRLRSLFKANGQVASWNSFRRHRWGRDSGGGGQGDGRRRCEHVLVQACGAKTRLGASLQEVGEGGVGRHSSRVEMQVYVLESFDLSVF